MSLNYGDYPLPKPIDCLRARRKVIIYDHENKKHYTQLPEVLVDGHYIQLTLNAIKGYWAKKPPRGDAPHVRFFLDARFFVSIKTGVLDFLKLHRLDLVELMVREGLILSWRRNGEDMEMQDVLPCLAVKFKVFAVGTNLQYLEAKAGIRTQFR